MRSLARQPAHTPDMIQAYGGIILEKNTGGFIEQVQTTFPTNSVHYIPHHPVKEESSHNQIKMNLQ